MKFLVDIGVPLLERGLLPDGLVRWGMRRLLQQKIIDEKKDGIEKVKQRLMALIKTMHQSPIAIHTQDANEQHYEMPTQFFQYCLGKHLKYSSCYFEKGDEPLSEAEAIMLRMTCERADLIDGQEILELGCGWGSLSLWMAAHFPKSRITGVSNSRTQKEFIDKMAKERGLENLTIITRDMNEFNLNQQFDRIVSVEMFEHMRNWQKLFDKAASLLKTNGKMFIHIFTHREFAYLYDHQDKADFIGKYFFTGGIMPSDDLMLYFQQQLKIDGHWRVSGHHYGQTANLWLKNMDSHQQEIMPLLAATYGEANKIKWWHYWRIFYMACAELWNYKGGSEWIVSHYRFIKIM